MTHGNRSSNSGFEGVAGARKGQISDNGREGRPTTSAMRIYRGCSRLAIRVPHLFVVGTRLDRDRQSYISRKRRSSAVSLPRAFPDLRVNVGA